MAPPGKNPTPATCPKEPEGGSTSMVPRLGTTQGADPLLYTLILAHEKLTCSPKTVQFLLKELQHGVGEGAKVAEDIFVFVTFHQDLEEIKQAMATMLITISIPAI
ncbi:UNVERIFIED_CONTAM: hypothetical protein FKN15_005461 [Acipenser sinensis]